VTEASGKQPSQHRPEAAVPGWVSDGAAADLGAPQSAEPAAGGDTFGQLLAPLTLRTAGERIAERFVTAIALGEFVPDQQLPSERDLAQLLKVSRTTVREALQRLHAAGYVTTRRGRGGGTFVKTGSGAELSEVLDFRQLIEQQIARAAAERRDDRDIAAIREAVAAYERASDRTESRIADAAVHLAVAQAAHNGRLTELSGEIRRQVSLGFDAEPYSPEVRRRAMHQHPELAEAVIAGDAETAASVAAAHFSLTEDLLRELHARIRLRSEGDLHARGHD
jgi:DNA-binding FadR family transcriptional regulator